MKKKHERADEDELLLEALSPLVNQLIDRNYTQAQKKMASQIAPLLGSAIREQVKSQKNDIIDALYPVLGSMISRYVTKTLEETIEAINRQIHNGLSFENIKRKLRAKLQGVSETELLLRESALANVRAWLLIHKETGIVLAEAQNPEKPLQEPEMIASMMSAISSFVNDWIDKNENNTELGEIEYGNSKIILENGGYCYLAVVVDGIAQQEIYNNIRNALAFILREYGDEIREFSGDLSGIANREIYHEVGVLLAGKQKQEEPKTQKKHPLLYILPLFLLGYFFWSLYASFIDRSLEQKIYEKLEQNKVLSLYKIDIDVEKSEVYLRGVLPLEYYKEMLTESMHELQGIETIHNEIQVHTPQNDPMQMSSNIHFLLLGLNTQEGIRVSYRFIYPDLEVFGEVWDQERKERVIRTFKDAIKLETMDFHIQTIAPELETKLFFDQGSSSIRPQGYKKLMNLSKELAKLGNDVHIELSGHTDNTGTPEAKKVVVEQRVQKVSALLQEKYGISQKIDPKYKYVAPLGVDAFEDPQAARCVIIKLKTGR